MRRIVTENKLDDGTVVVNDEFLKIVNIIDSTLGKMDKTVIYDVALLLRKGLNPNVRIDKVHVIPYLYSQISDKDERFELLILLFLSYGSNPTENVSDINEYRIIDWLNDDFLRNVYGGSFNSSSRTALPSRLKNIDLYTQNLIGYLTGNKDFLMKKIEEKDMKIIMLSLTSSSFFDEDTSEEIYPKNLELFKGPDRLVLSQAVDYGDPIIINFYSRLGIFPSYSLINNMILMYKYEKEEIIRDIYERMLRFIIKDGVRIDSYQNNLILDSGLNFDTEYKIPYWKKVCNNLEDTRKVQTRVKSLSLAIGVRYNYYDELVKLSEIDFEELNTFLLNKREHEIIDSIDMPYMEKDPVKDDIDDMALHHMSEFIVNTVSTDNSSVKITTYDSSMFKHIIDTRRDLEGNVIQNEILDIMEDKLRILKRYGIKSKSDPISIETGLKKLFKEDTYDDDISNEASRKFISRLDDRQSRSFDTSSKEFLNSILLKMDYISNINILPPEHAKITYIRIYDRYRKVNPAEADSMISGL